MNATVFQPIKRLILIGVGLIGGSFVLDLKRAKCVETVVGIDLDADNLERALERRVIDQAFTEINAQSISDADLILIATPVATLPHICQQLVPYVSQNTVISDVGSTKQSAIQAFKQFLPEHFERCVAAHPIAGSDRSGALAAQFGLYQNKKLILCPHEQQNSASLECVGQLWERVGARVFRMNAREHDEIFAAVSHFPHLLAFSYVHQILDDEKGEHYLQFAGSGFRDFTRIAASSPKMWNDILFDNQEVILELIEQQQKQLDFIQKCLKNQDKTALLNYISAAQNVRENWGN